MDDTKGISMLPSQYETMLTNFEILLASVTNLANAAGDAVCAGDPVYAMSLLLDIGYPPTGRREFASHALATSSRIPLSTPCATQEIAS
jgi:hypothetical protein